MFNSKILDKFYGVVIMEDNSKVKFVSLYWNNIDETLLKIQSEIFSFFGINIDQQLYDKMPHGIWIESILSQMNDEDILVVVDIDCVPLNKEIIKKAIDIANSGGIFGCAQAANHLNPDFIYAAPMFLAIKRKTWKDLGSPTFQEKDKFDVGGYLSYIALGNNVPIHFIYPTASAIYKWKLANQGMFGIFTVYEESIIHLFESRITVLNNTLLKMKNSLIQDYDKFDYRDFVIQAADEYCKKITKDRKKNFFSKLLLK